MRKKNWFKSRGYTHFTSRLDSEKIGFVNSFASNPQSISAHRFYPLIHRTIFEKKYKEVEINGQKVRSHYKIENGKKTSTAKPRQIFYANHLDAHIYSYYTQNILSPLYEKRLLEDEELSNAVLAYRRIEVEDGDRCKCNIDFANDTFDIIKSLKGEHTIFAFDISKFFDSLNHKILKQKWCELLGRKDLPDDHYKIYKSLIDFCYVEINDILKEFNFKHPNQLIQKNISNFLNDGAEFRERVKLKGLLKLNPFRHPVTKAKVGIPQGTPISAFLANLYMLDYDKELIDFVKSISGIYRRYSDDILVICPKRHESEVVDFVIDTINKFHLTIQKSKTQKTVFVDGRLQKGEQPLKYLGFEFDGKFKRIKSSSISKYYRNMKRLIKSKAWKAKKMKRKYPERAFIYKKSIYNSYSHFKSKIRSNRKRNYLSYVNLASELMGNNVKKQLSKSWSIINSEIHKWNEKYNLLEAGEYEFIIPTIEISDEEFKDVFPDSQLPPA